MSDPAERIGRLPQLLEGDLGWFLSVPLTNLSGTCRGSCCSKSHEGNGICRHLFQDLYGFICLKELLSHKPRWCTRSHGQATIQVAPGWEEGHLAKASRSLFYKWQALNQFPVKIMDLHSFRASQGDGVRCQPHAYNEVSVGHP